MSDLQSMIDSFNSPPTRHAMLVHLPIVLALVGCALSLLAAFMPRNATLRALAIGCQIALVAAAFAALNSGEHAEAHASSSGSMFTRDAQTLISRHEDMADRVWMFGVGGVALLSLAAASKKSAMRLLFAWAAFALTGAAVAWIGQTAHIGGKLVYEHGIGTPRPVSRDVAPIESPGLGSGRPTNSAPAAPTSAPEADAAISSTFPSTDESAGDEDSQASPQVVFFRTQVFPVLSDRCFNCHNARRVAAGKSGGLDQTSLETILQGGRSGPAIVPGKPEESLMIHRLRGDDPELDIMPPKGKLPDETIAIIEQWIRDGAVWAEPTS
jgi:uncharacterized membrane protein